MTLRKADTEYVAALLEYIKDRIELIYADGYKRYCYPILANLIVDYKKQVFIIGIKANIQYSICYVLPKKENK